MPFTIRTNDGRVTICTPSAEEAAKHVRRLQAEGAQVLVSGHSGEQLQIDRLHELANAHAVDPILTSKRKPRQ